MLRDGCSWALRASGGGKGGREGGREGGRRKNEVIVMRETDTAILGLTILSVVVLILIVFIFILWFVQFLFAPLLTCVFEYGLGGEGGREGGREGGKTDVITETVPLFACSFLVPPLFFFFRF